MSLPRREPRPNNTAGFAFAKPDRREKKSRRKEIAPPPRIAANVHHAGYLAWIHQGPCVVTGLVAGSWNPARKEYVRIDASHVGVGGASLKHGGDFCTVPKEHRTHMDWTEGTGQFKEWTKEARAEAAVLWLEATHRRWFALTDEERAEWQERAIAEREAMREAAAERRKKIKRGTIAGPSLGRRA